jgi:uncharacterized membrane protein
MVNVDKVNSGDYYRFVLSPNCSISWSELVVFYLVICLFALAVGLFFTLQGLWLVLPFSGLEMLALGLGLHLTSRRVCRREIITFDWVESASRKAYGKSISPGNSRPHGFA